MAHETPASASGDDPADIPSPAEEGDFMPITQPLVAAFEVGRQQNRLSFHLQQAWFFAGDYHVKAAEEAMRGLRRAYAVLLPVSLREEAHRYISARVGGLIKQVCSERHADDMTEVNRELRERSKREPLDDQPLECRRQALEHVFEVLANLCKPLLPRLDDRAHLALRLGELIDQGLCPPDIYRDLDRPLGNDCSTWETKEITECVVNFFDLVDNVPNPDEDGLLAGKSVTAHPAAGRSCRLAELL